MRVIVTGVTGRLAARFSKYLNQQVLSSRRAVGNLISRSPIPLIDSGSHKS